MRVPFAGLVIVAVTVLGLVGLVTGCDDLSEFKTLGTSGEFSGCVVGAAADSFIRSGFPNDTLLRLDFDPDQAQARDKNFVAAESATMGEVVPMTVLRPNPRVAHDALSGFDFPGGGRLRNYVYFIRPTGGGLVDRDAAVYVSLMDNGDIELRIVGPPGPGETEEGAFGLFTLTRRDRGKVFLCPRP